MISLDWGPGMLNFLNPLRWSVFSSFSLPLVVQSLSRVQLFETPWTAACQPSLSLTISWLTTVYICPWYFHHGDIVGIYIYAYIYLHGTCEYFIYIYIHIYTYIYICVCVCVCSIIYSIYVVYNGTLLYFPSHYGLKYTL